MIEDNTKFLRALNELERYEGYDPEKWREIKQRVLNSLGATTICDDIRPFCDNGRDIDLPDEIAFGAYERLLELGCADSHVLYLYAFRLECSGPEFDEKAHKMRKKARRLEGSD